MPEKRVISGDFISDPVKVKLTGLRYFLVALGTITLSWAAWEIAGALNDANELKRSELEIQKQRLDLAKRQYTLDSLRYFAPQKLR